ncbi:MAG: diguanylate cyclase [Magnetococcales bacterium]|nr:diguanylate cyclase [Magnetococcales bacterium]
MPHKPLPKPKLFLLLLVMPGILWFGVLAAGFKGLMTIRDNQDVARQDREQLSLGVQTIDLIDDIKCQSKSQIQAWKNILLRGTDPNQRTKYVQMFETKGQLVQDLLRQLPGQFQRLGLDRPILQQVNDLQEQHHALDVRYRAALQRFIDQLGTPASEREMAHAADNMVIDLDSATSEETDRLSDAVSQHVQRLVKQAGKRDEAWFAEETNQVAWALLGLGLVVLPISFFVVRNRVIRPITQMTAAIEQVANGNLKQRVASQNVDELSRMRTSFNRMTEELDRIHSGLQDERDKLTTIIVAAQEGIVVTDRQGEVVLINPAAERLLQKSAAQIMHEGFLNLLDDPEYLRAYLDQSGVDMPSTVLYQNRVLSVYASTIHTPDDILVGSAALFRDITEEKQLEKQLRTLSNTDALTGLHNRRRLDEIINDEFSRAKRYQQDMAVLMLDVDHFKRFNDEHGHDQGDRVLQAVADVIQSSCRDVDFPCRYGGEEFCLILPSTSLEGAKRMAERLRSGVEQMAVNGLQVTISVGVAIYPLVGPDPEALQKAADAALYLAKRTGRNRYCVAEPEAEPEAEPAAEPVAEAEPPLSYTAHGHS